MSNRSFFSLRTLFFRPMWACLTALLTTHSWATSSANIEQLVAQTVTAEVAARYPQGSYTVTPIPVAAASRLKPCGQLTAEIRSKNLYGRVPVHIRCEDSAPWSLYASASVAVQIPVIVSRQAIARGQRIRTDTVEFQSIAMHRLRPQTMTQLEDVIGKVARRAISANQPITLHQLSTPPTIAKGERVTIQANTGRVNIQTYGVALSSGQSGEQIEVRNETSKRVIKPWVIGPGKVATAPVHLIASP